VAKRKTSSPTQDEILPFPGGLPEKPQDDGDPLSRRLSHPIWTENKAKLIERYLQYFVFVTHHGTYIDGFAGPQEPDVEEHWPDMWAAKLVLESEPKWFRHFHLFDIDPGQVRYLENLKEAQPSHDSKGRKVTRSVDIYCQDFNVGVHHLLGSNSISQKEATFCLLDQRTFQCHWSTIEALARYKQPGYNKIELFYFLAVGWLGRSIKATTQDFEKLRCWWGRDDWEQFLGIRKPKQADIFVARFKQELQYKSVKPYPIFSKQDGGTIMYYMIHATDHPVAPGLMGRAYERAGYNEPCEQLEIEFEAAHPPPEEQS
jgi:three-Cys-motif partner protein